MKAIRPGAPTARDVACPHCGAARGSGCLTSSKKPAANIHRARWAELRYMRMRGMVVEIIADDPRLGLLKGERYRAAPYSLDPGSKVTLLSRVGDGHDPECNQYLHQFAFVDWARPDRTHE